MTIAAKDVLERASILLNDTGNTRWTLAQLYLWLQDAELALARAVPTAFVQTVALSLAAGVDQSVAAAHIALIRVLGNTSGDAITIIDRDVLDATVPGWRQSTVYAAADDVEHVVFDGADPKSFMVFPANTGSGSLDVRVSVRPPALASQTSTDLADYTATLATPDEWRDTLTDYVCWRAYQVDSSIPASAARADRHWNAFAAAAGLKVQSETALNPDVGPTKMEG